MKLWATLAAAGMIAGSAFAATSSTPVQDGMNRWAINVGLFIPEGDLKDAGVDSGFMVGADWMLPYDQGMQNMSSYVGVLGMFGSGDGDLDTMSYGIHYGVLLNLGEANNANNLRLRGQLGYYNHSIEAGSFDEDEWGLGGLVGLDWRPNNGQFSLAGGYYFMPEVDGTDNRGWFFQVTIPVR